MTKTAFTLFLLFVLASCDDPKSIGGPKPIILKPSSALLPKYGTVNCKEIYSFFRKSDNAWIHAEPQFVCVPEKDKDGNLIWRAP